MPRYPLPVCKWRRPGCMPGRQGCVSPIVKAGPFGVVDSTCYACDLADHLDQLQPAPRRTTGDFIRHLIYHLYPVGEWKWHCDLLRQYISLFNGRRIMSLALGEGTATVHEVARELEGLCIELWPNANDPNMKEMVSYPRLLEALRPYAGPLDVHFYAHGKGVVSQEQLGPAAKRWAEAMYAALLGHWPAVANELETHHTVGIFRRLWEGPLRTKARWHYSGTFRWVRNDALFSRPWERFDLNWLGSETHVGLVFGRGESSCLYGEFDTQDIGLYADSEWERWAAPRRREWEEANRAARYAPHLTTVILTAHRQPQLVHEAIASVLKQSTDSWQLIISSSGAIEQQTERPWDRYALDSRITVLRTGEDRAQVGRGQSWAINQAMGSGKVRGDSVLCLSDDDLLAPEWIATVQYAFARQPDVKALVGWASVQYMRPDGTVTEGGRLPRSLKGGKPRRLHGQVDGCQMAVRRSSWLPWPEEKDKAKEADGYWMDALTEACGWSYTDVQAAVHRHTPLSTFTQRPGGS